MIDNLIKNSETIQAFDTSLDLIKNANDLIQQKMDGIQLAEKYKKNLAILKQECIKKIEDKRAGMLNEYLEGLIR